MSRNSNDPKVLLKQIAEFMARETEEMSDEELLEELSDVTGSALLHVEKLKRLLEERSATVRRDRLAEARAKYEKAMMTRQTRVISRPPIAEIKLRVQEVFTNRGEMPLAIAFRNGEYQSDDDLCSLFDQLCELGVIDPKQV
jgi:hypothetical protein